MRKFWQVWLMLLGDGMVVVGLAMMLAPLSVVFQPLNDGAFARFFGAAAAPPEALAYHSFLFGLLGAATVGWGLLVFFVAWKPFARGEAWSWVVLALEQFSTIRDRLMGANRFFGQARCAAQCGTLGKHRNAPEKPSCPTEGRVLLRRGGVACLIRNPISHGDTLLATAQNNPGQTAPYGRELLWYRRLVRARHGADHDRRGHALPAVQFGGGDCRRAAFDRYLSADVGRDQGDGWCSAAGRICVRIVARTLRQRGWDGAHCGSPLKP